MESSRAPGQRVGQSHVNTTDQRQQHAKRRGRGGIGKYLRAQGRRGGGRPAEFGTRLLLEGEKAGDQDADQSESDSDSEGNEGEGTVHEREGPNVQENDVLHSNSHLHRHQDQSRRRYQRRALISNADRYAEPEPELGSDGTLHLDCLSCS